MRAPSLLVNQVRNANHWIAVHTVGTKSNRDGIGARIRVKTGNAHPRRRSPQRLELTIRTATCESTSVWAQPTKIEWVEIRWPSGLTERFANLTVDQIHTLKEGTGTAEPEAKKP